MIKGGFMKKNNDWNPLEYLKFKNERNLPSIDLVNKINISHYPGNVLDIGCGPGNSSQVLLRRWPGCRLTGIDNSPGMIDKAKKDYPDREWEIADAHAYLPEKEFDVVFSNATFQWIPDHEGLIKKYSAVIAGGGALAVQLPQFFEMPFGKSLEFLANSGKWKSLTGGCSGLFTTLDPGSYYDILSDYFDHVDLWKTDYIHILDSHKAVFDMIKFTGMRPYLERLGTDSEREDFEAAVLAELKTDYPVQKDGRVLFPFKRLFFIAYRRR
jgi:trans-aconitate 2-methyltransferase